MSPMTRSPLKSDPARWLGAGIVSVDPAKQLNIATASSIPTALLKRIMTLLRDQQLTPPQLMGPAERIGGIVEYLLGKPLRGCSLVLPTLRGCTTGSTSATSGPQMAPTSSAPRPQQGWPPRRQSSRSATLADPEVPHLE